MKWKCQAVVMSVCACIRQVGPSISELQYDSLQWWFSVPVQKLKVAHSLLLHTVKSTSPNVPQKWMTPSGVWPWGIQIGPLAVHTTYFCQIDFHFINRLHAAFPFSHYWPSGVIRIGLPSMKVKKFETFQKKRGSTCCKWPNLNAPGTQTPLHHPIPELTKPNLT